MKWLLCLLLAISTQSFAQYRTESDLRYSSQCQDTYKSGGRTYVVSCGSERVTGVDNRPRLPIAQPVGPTGLKGACDGNISAAESYKAVVNPLTCGEGAIGHDRIQTPLSKQLMNKWSVISRSGTPDAEKRMQEVRKIDLKFEGEIDYPVFESWSYEAMDGGYNASCGMEAWDTQCAVSRSVQVSEPEQVEDRSNCLEYEILPDEPVSTGNSGYNSGGYTSPTPPRDSYNPGNSPVDRSTPKKDKGAGESKSEGRSKSKGYFDEGSIREITFDRSPASRRGQCLKYGKKWITKTWIETKPDISYQCLKQRPRWCTWPVRLPVARRCADQKVKYSVQYEHDSKWVPGYVDAKSRHRDYQQILPNKFELLVGESENFTVFNNYGESTQMRPAFKIDSKWNEYTQSIEPKALSCEYKKTGEFKVSVFTVGRNLVKAPNPLALPKDADGKDIFPLKVENGKPTRLYLQDLGRSTQVRAAELSRMFSKPDNAAKAQRATIYSKAKVTSNEVTGLVGDAYWQETQYRFQLYEKGRWGRTSMLTVPTTFGSNQGYAMRDRLEISLVGEDAIKDSYRAAGPAHKMLGWLWEQTGAEFTPGQTYHFKVQALPRGLPFYESGCKNGQVTCEGQEGNESAYSEPVTIQWLAPKDIDNRSLFKKFKDFQKDFQIL